MARTRLWRKTGYALAAVAVIGLCSAVPASADPEAAVISTSEQTANRSRPWPTPGPRQPGSASSWPVVVTWWGRWSRTGRLAADYPAFDGSQGGPRAVVAVRSTGPHDELDPGPPDSCSEPTYALMPSAPAPGPTTGTTSSSVACTPTPRSTRSRSTTGTPVAGSRATAGCCASSPRPSSIQTSGIRSPARGGSGRVVSTSSSRGAHQPRRHAGRGGHHLVAVLPSGNTSFNRGTPLSVGGKLTPGPTINTASDQFNGRIDNAFFRDF